MRSLPETCSKPSQIITHVQEGPFFLSRRRFPCGSVRCKIPRPFFSRKPPALTLINRGKSTIDPEMTSINVCYRPIFCDFPSVSAEILTAPIQIGTHNLGFSVQFPAKKRNLTPKKCVRKSTQTWTSRVRIHSDLPFADVALDDVPGPFIGPPEPRNMLINRGFFQPALERWRRAVLLQLVQREVPSTLLGISALYCRSWL